MGLRGLIIAGFQGYMAKILGQVSNEEKPWQNFSVEEDEIAIYMTVLYSRKTTKPCQHASKDHMSLDFRNATSWQRSCLSHAQRSHLSFKLGTWSTKGTSKNRFHEP